MSRAVNVTRGNVARGKVARGSVAARLCRRGSVARGNVHAVVSCYRQYAVRPKYQGLGIGSALWKKVMEHIGTERNISLFFPDKMLEICRNKLGFVTVPEKRFHVYNGKVNCDNLIKQLEGVELVLINEYNVIAVSEYDKQICYGLDRRQLIEECCKTPQTVCLAAVNEENQQIMGYSIIKATISDMATFEPLYADNEQIAELLISKCYDLLPIAKTNGIMFRCWNFNEKAITLANKMGLNFDKAINLASKMRFNFVGKEPILFTKELVEGKIEKIYCISARGFYPF